jgi:hypothetical protein
VAGLLFSYLGAVGIAKTEPLDQPIYENSITPQIALNI